MGIANQLYQLQEVDLKLKSNEQALNQIVSQLGESQTVVRAQIKLASENQRLDELLREQHSVEWEIDDLTNKLTAVEKKLYSGEVSNSKELTNLQHEIGQMRDKRAQLEDKTLEIMELAELAKANVATMNNELKTSETEWHSQQQQLSAQIEQLKTILSNLEDKRQQLLADIEPKTVEFYDKLKKQRGTAVAKVEQGICHGCRISLPTTEVQQARSNSLVQCSSCGRILFLA